MLLGGLLLGVAVSALAADQQRTFASAEAAAAALDAAWQSGSQSDLLAIFGPAGEKLVNSGDPVADQAARNRLAAAYAEQHHIELDGDRKAVIVLGKDEWPYPIPLERPGFGWKFDTAAGAEQIIDRRVGRNELNAINVCRGYVDAQREYAAEDPLHDGRHEYAQKVLSSDGRRDGLYWPASRSDDESPLGPLVAAAEAGGYPSPSEREQVPFHGYFYRILTRQGPNAPGGAHDYVVNGHMTGGFALVAYPARWGDAGVMTFIVNQDGIVFQKNLGHFTGFRARHMNAYDPDQSWSIAQP
jgi:hypothetical protein